MNNGHILSLVIGLIIGNIISHIYFENLNRARFAVLATAIVSVDGGKATLDDFKKLASDYLNHDLDRVYLHEYVRDILDKKEEPKK